jgi:16S rRNA U1498 N3-methylase RsmE
VARAAGFVPVGLGPRILRVETAAIVAVALAQESIGALGALPPSEG